MLLPLLTDRTDRQTDRGTPDRYLDAYQMLCGQRQQVERHPPVLQFCSAIHRKFANKQQIFAQSDFSDKKCTTRCRQQLQNVTVNNKLRPYSHSHTLRKDENDSTKSADYEAGDIKLQTQVYYSLYRSTPRLTHTHTCLTALCPGLPR